MVEAVSELETFLGNIYIFLLPQPSTGQKLKHNKKSVNNYCSRYQASWIIFLIGTYRNTRFFGDGGTKVMK